MIRTSVLLFLLALYFAGSILYAHDIHISYSKAELKGSDLFVKVSYYKDDLTNAVKNWYAGKADGLAANDFRSAEFEYVKNYFRVWAGEYSKPIAPSLLNIID